MRTIGLFCVFISSAYPVCIVVPSNQILAKDISPAIPLFRALDPNDAIGFAPFPGMVRVMSSRDIAAAAQHYGLAFPPGELAPSVCIERMVHPLSPAAIKAAMSSALKIPGVDVQVLDFSRQGYPPGQLEFPLATLNHSPGNDPQTAVVWTGRLIFDNNRSLSVWVRVRLAVIREVVVANQDIARGTSIRPDQITIMQVSQFPTSSSAEPPASIAGKIARRPFKAGQIISADALDDAQEVVRGETVHVRSTDGAATILCDGIAQGSGRKGDVIVVHNPASGKNFRATVEGRQQVIVRGSL